MFEHCNKMQNKQTNKNNNENPSSKNLWKLGLLLYNKQYGVMKKNTYIKFRTALNNENYQNILHCQYW